VLHEFVPVLQSWMTGEGVRTIDPFETEYSENYAPANAAVILAGVYRHTGESRYRELSLAMVRRSVELLQKRDEVNPFCRVFLFHYSLMAMLMLPEPDRASSRAEFAAFYSGYVDDCLIVNTNCAALQWGMEIFLEALNFRGADGSKLEKLLGHVERAQLESGFINDEVSEREAKDGMPIAYHAFTLFILTGVAAAAGGLSPAFAQMRPRVETILAKGMRWLMHAAAPDGTFAMTERSSYQMFTWGAWVALLSATPLRDTPLFRQAWEYWLKYRHSDGSFSCTPNFLPHELRAGFEGYTHVNMYNNLGLTGIVVAEKLIEESLNGGRQMLDLQLPEDGFFADPESGYAFFLRGDRFFGCALRMHNRRYVPALTGFHYRLGGVRFPLAEPKFNGFRAKGEQFLFEGIWEGFLLKDEDNRYVYPDAQHNAAVERLDDGIRLTLDTEDLNCVKEIRLSERGIRWIYRLTAKRRFASCAHVLPLLVYDGKEGLRVVEKSQRQLELNFAGRTFSLSCDGAAKLAMSLKRSLLSVSGAAALVTAPVADELPVNGSIAWETRMELL